MRVEESNDEDGASRRKQFCSRRIIKHRGQQSPYPRNGISGDSDSVLRKAP